MKKILETLDARLIDYFVHTAEWSYAVGPNSEFHVKLIEPDALWIGQRKTNPQGTRENKVLPFSEITRLEWEV